MRIRKDMQKEKAIVDLQFPQLSDFYHPLLALYFHLFIWIPIYFIVFHDQKHAISSLVA